MVWYELNRLQMNEIRNLKLKKKKLICENIHSFSVPFCRTKSRGVEGGHMEASGRSQTSPSSQWSD